MVEYTDVVEKENNEKFKKETKITEYNEQILSESDANVGSLAKKIQNIQILLRNQSSQLVSELIISQNYFSNNLNTDGGEISNFDVNYCKQKCQRCTAKCTFSEIELNLNNSLLTSRQIINEIKRHGHPKSRKRNNIGRSLNEAKAELQKHYENNH